MGKRREIKNNSKGNKTVLNNTRINETAVRNDKILGNKIILRFSNFNLRSIKLKNNKFSNFQKDIYETHKTFNFFLNIFLKHFEKMTIEDLQKEKHCHFLNGEKEEICYKILSEYDSVKKEKINFFQFGLKNIRVISHKLGENIYELLFLDPFHLIYPDENYNQNDWDNYTCCMVNLNAKTNNFKNEFEKLKKENQELKEKIKSYEELLEEKTT